MRVAARGVSTKIEKEGARVALDEKGAVVIYMDGKVQQVFEEKKEIDEGVREANDCKEHGGESKVNKKGRAKMERGDLLLKHVSM